LTGAAKSFLLFDIRYRGLRYIPNMPSMTARHSDRRSR